MVRSPPSLTRSAASAFPQDERATQPIARPDRSAEPERNRETSSPTSPEHPVQTALFPDQALESRSVQESPACATSPQTAAPAIAQRLHARRSRYRNRRLCRTAPLSASSSPTRDRRGKSPCSERRELVHAQGSPLRSSAAVRSHPLPLTVFSVLRRANEHLHEIVVERVIELPLEAPLKLRIVEVPRMQIEIVRMHRNAFILEPDDDFHAVAFRARRESQQRMFVEK